MREQGYSMQEYCKFTPIKTSAAGEGTGYLRVDK